MSDVFTVAQPRPRRPRGTVQASRPPADDRTAGREQASQVAVASALGLPSFVAGILGVDSSLMGAWQRILDMVRNQQIDPNTEVGRARIDRIIRETSFYKGYTESARAFLLREKADPAQAAAQLQQTEDALRAALVQGGAQMGEQELKETARLIVMGGKRNPTTGVFEAFTEQDQQKIIAGAVDWSANGLTGKARASEQEIFDLAKAYGFGDVIGQRNLQGWVRTRAKGVMDGTLSIDSVRNELRDYAKSRYPAFSRQLDAGIPLDDLIRPYRVTLADMLETDENAISLMDPLMEQALGAMVDGQQTVLPLWEFKRNIRRDPRWLATDRAMNTYQSIAGRVLEDFGFMGGL